MGRGQTEIDDFSFPERFALDTIPSLEEALRLTEIHRQGADDICNALALGSMLSKNPQQVLNIFTSGSGTFALAIDRIIESVEKGYQGITLGIQQPGEDVLHMSLASLQAATILAPLRKEVALLKERNDINSLDKVLGKKAEAAAAIFSDAYKEALVRNMRANRAE